MNATPSKTREKLISEGMRQLLSNGYEGVGIGPILAAVKVPKGSFYHFFESKDDFVVAVIETYAKHYRELREAAFADGSLSPMSRLDRHFEVLEQEVIECHPSGGCLYGVIAQTVSERVPAVRAAVTASFVAWEQGLRDLLTLAQREGEISAAADPGSLAARIIDAYEGTLIRMKATDDLTAFGRFRRDVIASLVGTRS